MRSGMTNGNRLGFLACGAFDIGWAIWAYSASTIVEPWLPGLCAGLGVLMVGAALAPWEKDL